MTRPPPKPTTADLRTLRRQAKSERKERCSRGGGRLSRVQGDGYVPGLPQPLTAWIVWEFGLRHPNQWFPIGGTISTKRHISIALYNQLATHNDYATDKRNGWVRCEATTLTPKAQSKRKPKARRNS